MSTPGTWLLTGGAGYIGAHIVEALRAQDVPVVVLDDLSTGSRAVLPADVPLVEASVLDRDAVRTALREHDVQGVIHLAGEEGRTGSRSSGRCTTTSRTSPAPPGCSRRWSTPASRKVVFSSSAATYGTPATELVTEDSPTVPESPYGESKLVSEWIIRDCAKAHGLAYVNLRYFNVAGAGSPALGDRGVFNLVPLVFRALSAGVTAEGLRRRLPDPRRHLHPRLHPRRRPRRGPRGRGAAPRRGPRARRSSTSAAARG